MSGMSKEVFILCGGISYLMVHLLLELHFNIFSFVISIKYNLLKVRVTFCWGFVCLLEGSFCCFFKDMHNIL